MIGIITPGNLKYTPYIQNYIDILKTNGIKYKVMSWNKAGIREDGVDFSFNYKVSDSNRKKMLFGYLGFIRKCKKYIKKHKIDKLIILTAAPAFFLKASYLSRFKGGYILDIRDDSPLIRKFPDYFKRLCSKAKSVVVSSNEFSPWTGRKTILCHNVDLPQLRIHKDDDPEASVEYPIRIVFAGVMIEGPCNVEVLKAFQKDVRFEHIFIGRDSSGKKLIQDFVKKSEIKNVTFEGAYNKEEIIDIYRKKADLINIFRAKTTVNRNALPNKLYEAVLSGKPIVVFKHNIAIAKYAEKYNLGIVIPNSLQDDLNEYIFNKIHLFNYSKYKKGRDGFLKEVENDMNTFFKMVLEFSFSVKNR